jgi:hypothetical protein
MHNLITFLAVVSNSRMVYFSELDQNNFTLLDLRNRGVQHRQMLEMCVIIIYF